MSPLYDYIGEPGKRNRLGKATPPPRSCPSWTILILLDPRTAASEMLVKMVFHHRWKWLNSTERRTAIYLLTSTNATRLLFSDEIVRTCNKNDDDILCRRDIAGKWAAMFPYTLQEGARVGIRKLDNNAIYSQRKEPLLWPSIPSFYCCY